MKNLSVDKLKPYLNERARKIDVIMQYIKQNPNHYVTYPVYSHY